MASTYNLMMPLMICNLGVEITYLLSMRMRVQKIDEAIINEKINSIVMAVFDTKMMDEMRKKQKVILRN